MNVRTGSLFGVVALALTVAFVGMASHADAAYGRRAARHNCCCCSCDCCSSCESHGSPEAAPQPAAAPEATAQTPQERRSYSYEPESAPVVQSRSYYGGGRQSNVPRYALPKWSAKKF